MRTFEDIIDSAGEERNQPPPPKGGIPKQWLPGWIRWPVRVIMLPFIWLDLFAQKIAKKIIRPPFKQAGACKKRGNCCHYILIRHYRGVLGVVERVWHTQFQGFYKRDDRIHMYKGKPMHIMGCRYLKKDGSCGHYRLRPSVCRTWPRIEVFSRPEYLKGCGFFAQNRNSKLPLLDD